MKYNGTPYRYYYDTSEKIGIAEQVNNSEAMRQSKKYLTVKISSEVDKASFKEFHYLLEIKGHNFFLELDIFNNRETEIGLIDEVRFTIENPALTKDKQDLGKLEKMLQKEELALKPHYYYREDQFIQLKLGNEKIIHLLKLIAKHENFPGTLANDLNTFFKKKFCNAKISLSSIYKIARKKAAAELKKKY